MGYIILILCILLAIVVYFCFKFAMIIINVQEVIEESLDVLDEKYAKISEILNIPIFFDSKEVRDVLFEIKGVRDSILTIAQRLTNQEIIEEEFEVENDDQQEIKK
jgi:hypothetical protein